MTNSYEEALWATLLVAFAALLLATLFGRELAICWLVAFGLIDLIETWRR